MRQTKPEIREYITEICRGRRAWEIARMTNEKFGTHYTAQSIRSSLKNWGLKTGLGSGLRKGEGYRKFSLEISEFIRANYHGIGPIRMAEIVNEKFGTDFTGGQLKAFYARNSLKSGVTGYFKKGHEAFNKGMKWDDYMSEEAQEMARSTTFKPGNMPHNHKEMYHERVNTDGYTEIKIREKYPGEYGNKNFVLKHRLIWEQHNGPVPEGCIVTFRDGNKRNFDPDNLILISRSQNAVLNRSGRTGNPETLETELLIADIKLASGKRKKEKRKGKQHGRSD